MKRLAKYIPEDIQTDSSFKENYGWQLEDVEIFDKTIEAKGKFKFVGI